ncbi:hypothetical protein [Pseudanabaena mucicola]|uniref:Uncharacterized protein n=1 Tax=Pseudanabaena mucicola FACHB-723 TaxID=2692860 RepID=A0ABR8A3W0_9CYAN|nr:hypothetical protein [Pseudanabaena mucicola]MBD2189991.1 hypothetical protein [Pseudanabaena mucicola FACHB-723]
MSKLQEIQQKETELATLENQLTELQTPIAEPQSDNFDDVGELLQARRDWQQSERDRQDKLSAISDLLPKLRSQLASQKQGYADLETKVKAGFDQLAEAALEVNQILNQANEAIARFEALSIEQAKLGHAIVYGCEPYQIGGSGGDFPIFAVTSSKVTKWGRQQFASFQRGGHVGEDCKI